MIICGEVSIARLGIRHLLLELSSRASGILKIELGICELFPKSSIFFAESILNVFGVKEQVLNKTRCQSKGNRAGMSWRKAHRSTSQSLFWMEAHLYQPRAVVVKKTKGLEPLVEGHKVAFGSSHCGGQANGL